MSGSAEKKDGEKKEDDKKEVPKEGEAKDGAKKDGATKDDVDKDYVIFHFPGVEQADGTSAGCETLKIPRDAAIGLVQKVRPAVARLVERCPCNDPAPPGPEATEPMVPCVDCMAELKAEARRLSTKAIVQTAVSNMSIQQPCPFKAQSLTMTKSCPVPPQAPPLPDKITQQMSFIKISCGKCGSEQVMDPAQTAAIKGPAAAAAAQAATPGASTSGAGPCGGPGMMNVISSVPGSNTHIQFNCNCLEQFGFAPNGGGVAMPPIPHAPNCCYALGNAQPPTGRRSSSRGHNDHVRDRLIAEERRMMERLEEDDYDAGSPRRRSYHEFEERRTYGNGGGRSRSSRGVDDGRGRYEEDPSDVSEGGDDDDGRYTVRRTSSGNVAIIGDDNYKVRVAVGGRRSEGRRRGYR
ncbi:hypothetical protein HPB49_022106 [Dermacentor silvarum]|uniref:Uncharacterized protein n=1 Tax=Dermacentor silvarum TaxID=543639 RepID=A0ACB8DLA8_DERSI|nr:uncharacterized protein LOC119434051 isoform X1 [Dermacentor silvarum]KAH7971333.1 hypothetical protein HPB49_022106 [Dermacentor silvarum]